MVSCNKSGDVTRTVVARGSSAWSSPSDRDKTGSGGRSFPQNIPPYARRGVVVTLKPGLLKQQDIGYNIVLPIHRYPMIWRIYIARDFRLLILARPSMFESRKSIARPEGPAREKLEPLSFCTVSTTPHTFVQRIHRAPSWSQQWIDFWLAASRRANHADKVDKRRRYLHILTTHRDWLNGRIRDVTERLLFYR